MYGASLPEAVWSLSNASLLARREGVALTDAKITEGYGRGPMNVDVTLLVWVWLPVWTVLVRSKRTTYCSVVSGR